MTDDTGAPICTLRMQMGAPPRCTTSRCTHRHGLETQV